MLLPSVQHPTKLCKAVVGMSPRTELVLVAYTVENDILSKALPAITNDGVVEDVIVGGLKGIYVLVVVDSVVHQIDVSILDEVVLDPAMEVVDAV